MRRSEGKNGIFGNLWATFRTRSSKPPWGKLGNLRTTSLLGRFAYCPFPLPRVWVAKVCPARRPLAHWIIVARKNALDCGNSTSVTVTFRDHMMKPYSIFTGKQMEHAPLLNEMPPAEFGSGQHLRPDSSRSDRKSEGPSRRAIRLPGCCEGTEAATRRSGRRWHSSVASGRRQR